MKTRLLVLVMLLSGAEGALAQQIRQPPPRVHAVLPPNDSSAGARPAVVRDSARATHAVEASPAPGRTRGATIGGLAGLLLGGAAGYIAYKPAGSPLDVGRPALVFGGALVGGVVGAVGGAIIDHLHQRPRP